MEEHNNPNAEEYKNRAAEHMKKTKSSILTFLKTGVFIISSVVVFILLAMAWFANNDKVRSDTGGIRAKEKQIELRTYGSNGVHDDVLQKILGTDGDNGFWYFFKSDDSLDTSPEATSVNWLLSDESNLNNYSDKEIDWTDDENARTDYAIEPGASGYITFYIVPKYSGDITVKCTLESIPYYISNKEYIEATDDYIKKEVEGHILFFLHKEEDNSIEWIKNKEFKVSIPNAIQGEEYKYTIYWSWPQVFGEIILQDNDTYMNGKKPIYSGFSNGDVIRDSIVENMASNPDYYFYSSLTKKPLDTSYEEVGKISLIHAKSTDELLIEGDSDTVQVFVDLSSYYNQADQYIGKNVDFIRISLSAEIDDSEE